MWQPAQVKVLEAEEVEEEERGRQRPRRGRDDLRPGEERPRLQPLEGRVVY